ncbi:hypothetical protein B296_00038244 [Ensete ventricosum]|uniref:Uncharacterized protein n=1 Tax=Ensete ventricosum TaxID=4639 RepID=A0A426YGK2_ENSVE|nr:hypothetical protein B296_00038244 [Ensete ventricosum]
MLEAYDGSSDPTEHVVAFHTQMTLSRNLIHRCHLDQYIMKPREPSLCPKGPIERQIDVIVGASAAVGVSSSARKSYAHTEVQKRPRPRSDLGFTFKSESEYTDHNDALVSRPILQTSASSTS